jgi:hypothetical protein
MDLCLPRKVNAVNSSGLRLSVKVSLTSVSYCSTDARSSLAAIAANTALADKLTLTLVALPQTTIGNMASKHAGTRDVKTY